MNTENYSLTGITLAGITLAGIILNFGFRYTQTGLFFKNYICDPLPDLAPVLLDSEDLHQISEQYPAEQEGHISEIKMLSVALSDALLPYDRVIVHAVALISDGKAWLLTAPPGTGKSTQYRNLRRMYPGEIRILCGDNPILQFMMDGSILVHHSPWNGKEKYGAKRIAPLAGIILLEQSDDNIISAMSPDDAVIPLFRQMNSFLKTEEQAHMLFRMEDHLLKSFPLWKFQNLGDLASSEMLYQLIKTHLETLRRNSQ